MSLKASEIKATELRTINSIWGGLAVISSYSLGQSLASLTLEQQLIQMPDFSMADLF